MSVEKGEKKKLTYTDSFLKTPYHYTEAEVNQIVTDLGLFNPELDRIFLEHHVSSSVEYKQIAYTDSFLKTPYHYTEAEVNQIVTDLGLAKMFFTNFMYSCYTYNVNCFSYLYFYSSLREYFPRLIECITISKDMSSAIIDLKFSDNLFLFCTFLKYHFKYKFTTLSDIWAVDFFSKKRRFQINYSLVSISMRRRLTVRIWVRDSDKISSLGVLFASAGWLEREVWDMFGIFFIGHKDLRRILTDYGFIGHPLRKDFPLSGYVEVRYDEIKKRIVIEPLEVSQEFRFYKFVNPWNF